MAFVSRRHGIDYLALILAAWRISWQFTSMAVYCRDSPLIPTFNTRNSFSSRPVLFSKRILSQSVINGSVQASYSKLETVLLNFALCKKRRVGLT